VASARRDRRLVYLLLAGLAAALAAQDTVRTGLEGLAWQSPETVHAAERALVTALRAPLLGAKDCAAALQCWFDGRTADARGDKAAAIAAWEAGTRALTDLHDLPPPPWPDTSGARLTPQTGITGADLYLLDAFVVRWSSDAGTQFGLFMVPRSRPQGHRFPLLVYVHGGSAGLGRQEIAWLAEQCRKGYAGLAPALRGQPLADASVPQMSGYRCAGRTDDPAGAAGDLLAALQGTQAMPVVRPDGCALVGVGRGATAALLAAAHSSMPACVAVADARQLDPFRAYWTRMSRGENTWPDWANFCSREPAEQLASMHRRSVVHQAGGIRCPVLMLLPDGPADSLDAQAHRDVAAAVRAAGAEAVPEVQPGAARDFTDTLDSEPGRKALRRMLEFVYRHVPSDDGKDTLLTPP